MATATPLSERSRFPAIADYAFLPDCETSALVAPSGAVEWLCLPRFDGPAGFGSILDRDAGSFREPHSGRQLGNFPQAFSHLALVNAVVHLIRSERGEDPARFAPARR